MEITNDLIEAPHPTPTMFIGTDTNIIYEQTTNISHDRVKLAEISEQIALHFSFIEHNIVLEINFENWDGVMHVGWDNSRQKWDHLENIPEKNLDKTGESFPSMILKNESITNEQGEIYHKVTDLKTGEQMEIPDEIWLPGEGYVPITNLFSRTQQDWENYAMPLMTSVPELYETRKEYVEGARKDRIFVPGILFGESQEDNVSIFAAASVYPGSTNYFINSHINNEVIMPIIKSNNGKKQIVNWVRIHQGNLSSSKINAFTYKDGSDLVEYEYLRFTDKNLFGNSQNHSFVLMMIGKDFYAGHWVMGGAEPFLEVEGDAIGAEVELLTFLGLLELENQVSAYQYLENFIIFVLSPDILLYSNDN